MKNLINLMILLAIQTSAFGQSYKDWKTFECNKDCKSSLVFKMKYPSDWIAEDPDHYGILKKFRPQNIKGPGFGISIRDLKVKGTDKEIKELLSKSAQYNNLKNNLDKMANRYSIISVENVFIDSNYAVIMDYISEISKISGRESRICRDYNFVYENYLITMQAAIIFDGSLDAGQATLKKTMDKYSDIFNKIANSIIIKRD